MIRDTSVTIIDACIMQASIVSVVMGVLNFYFSRFLSPRPQHRRGREDVHQHCKTLGYDGGQFSGY